MERLNTLLAQMQSEDTTLADSVKLYAEAASLMEYCHAALEKTSLQIDEIDAKLAATVQEESYWTIRSSIRTIWRRQWPRWKRPAAVFYRKNPRCAVRHATA